MALISILHALWLFLPAYVANMSPVFSAKVLPKWNTPIDAGRKASDGRRVLGDGKTWRGLWSGAVVAGVFALGQSFLAAGPFDGLDFGRSDGIHPAVIFVFGFLVGLSALIGDAVKSYYKRRLDKPRGASWVPFDQLDFVVAALLVTFAASPLLGDWVWRAYFSDWLILATILVLTPLLHLLVNRIGFWLNLKEVPW